jgi:RHS repeat-associated protein
VKLQKQTFDNSDQTTNTHDYIGGIEYQGNVLEAIYTDEGRAKPFGTAYRYEYTIKDHLGNSRVMFCDIDNDGIVTESEIIQEEHYYPFGMRHEGYGRTITQGENFYQYNGKELNEDFGLDMYDYGARWYDASVGRWHGVDPLAEAFFVHSPYNYGVNNPIMMIDPDGRMAVSSGGGESPNEKNKNPNERLDYETRTIYSKKDKSSSSSNYVHGVSGGGLMASKGASGGRSVGSNDNIAYSNIFIDVENKDGSYNQVQVEIMFVYNSTNRMWEFYSHRLVDNISDGSVIPDIKLEVEVTKPIPGLDDDREPVTSFLINIGIEPSTPEQTITKSENNTTKDGNTTTYTIQGGYKIVEGNRESSETHEEGSETGKTKTYTVQPKGRTSIQIHYDSQCNHGIITLDARLGTVATNQSGNFSIRTNVTDGKNYSGRGAPSIKSREGRVTRKGTALGVIAQKKIK